MDITVFLSQIWGPVLLALGLGFFMSPKFYIKLYRDIERETFAVFFFGAAGIAAGIVQIQFHNVWETIPQIIVSLLGWGLVVKAATFTIFPKIADRGGDWAVGSKLVPGVGAVLVLLGGYLSWIGFFG